MKEELTEKEIKKIILENKAAAVICLLIATYFFITSSFWLGLIFVLAPIVGLTKSPHNRNEIFDFMDKINSKITSNSTLPFTSEIRRGNKTHDSQWDEISSLDDLHSSEKIKLVSIQDIPLGNGETIFAERHHKKYTISVTPQDKNCFEFATSNKITVFVIAGSKHEAFDQLSNDLSGKYSFTDNNSNIAESGRWYDGNKYMLEIIEYSKYKK